MSDEDNCQKMVSRGGVSDVASPLVLVAQLSAGSLIIWPSLRCCYRNAFVVCSYFCNSYFVSFDSLAKCECIDGFFLRIKTTACTRCA